MNSEVYRILYCSRNVISGSPAKQESEIANILAQSRSNNVACGVTGALLFNSGFFAQVLEGPLEQVERTFERIQRDMRHDEVAVLECGCVPQRDFPEWSMAYTHGATEDSARFSSLSLAEVVQDQTSAAEISKLLRSIVLQDDDLACV